MSNNFLPVGFEKLKVSKPYVNLSKLPEGEHRFRIVGRPIAGWIDWLDNKPYRFKPDHKPKTSFDPAKPIKAFWALHVWDYAKEGLYIMEITQNGIRRSLEEYAMNEDWGDLTSFDIKIKKEGSGKDTTYSVIPVPHKAMNATINKSLEETKIRLEALYEGKDPWNDLEESEITNPEVLSSKQIEQLNQLTEQITDQKYLYNLEEYLECVSLDCMHPKHFDRAVRSLEKKIKELNNESDVA